MFYFKLKTVFLKMFNKFVVLNFCLNYKIPENY